MKFLIEGFGEITRQVIFLALAIAYVAVCFWVFDVFHITTSATQVVVAIAPFLALAFWIWRRGPVK